MCVCVCVCVCESVCVFFKEEGKSERFAVCILFV